MDDVDFGYDDEQDRPARHQALRRRPGQKIAFVGSTGAGKTTITNLINRFYDIADGKIRYDGININKIKRTICAARWASCCRIRNLFTGTVMDNIRYGKLDATDEECIAAAKLANADDFITPPARRLRHRARRGDGCEPRPRASGSCCPSPARRVADPPVLILDEATSSIDTRTEALVQRGHGRPDEGPHGLRHRPPALHRAQNADCHHGASSTARIIERGTHDELIARRAQYYQLYTGNFEGKRLTISAAREQQIERKRRMHRRVSPCENAGIFFVRRDKV
ncbi:MAG: ATP-binding cassette domain-containing protein [Christensenellales bacterium]